VNDWLYVGVRVTVLVYYDPGRLLHTGSQDTDLSYHVLNAHFPFLLHRVTTIRNVTDRQTDRRTDVMLVA